jgi:hypothetical protein
MKSNNHGIGSKQEEQSKWTLPEGSERKKRAGCKSTKKSKGLTENPVLGKICLRKKAASAKTLQGLCLGTVKIPKLSTV